jgi:hypothetical protein
LLGRGPLEGDLREQAAGLPATFCGFEDDPRDAYAAADLLVLTSRHEGLGLVLVEAAQQAVRDHHKHDEFIGPRFLVYAAALEMHPLDTEDRLKDLKDESNIGYCNITKCCTKVCPENITITDNAIIPLKERVVDEFYDPITKFVRLFRKKSK